MQINMKRRNYIYLGLAIVLVILAFYFINKERSGSFTVSRKAFAVEDTASIDKIFIASKSGQSITLTKKFNGVWFVNDKYRVNDQVLINLMDAIKRVEVKSPVSKNTVDRTLKTLSTTGIKVEIYAKDKIVNAYFVGPSTGDDLGTYYIQANSDVPVVCHIPGFDGYLTVRYSTKIDDWRNKNVFRIAPQEIASIKVDFPGDAKNSFLLELMEKDFVRLTNFKGDTAGNDIDPEFLRFFIGKFSNLGFEFREPGLRATYIDSVLKMANYANVEVKLKDGSLKKVQLFTRFIDKEGELTAFDTDPAALDPLRMWIYFPEEKEWAAGQNQVIQPITPRYSSFFKPAAKK